MEENTSMQNGWPRRRHDVPVMAEGLIVEKSMESTGYSRNCPFSLYVSTLTLLCADRT